MLWMAFKENRKCFLTGGQGGREGGKEEREKDGLRNITMSNFPG